MAHWYYKGRSTTPIDHPEKGPIVLTPMMRFEAPIATVNHLIQANLVKRLPDPPKKAEVHVQTSAPAAVPVAAPVVPAPAPKEVPAPAEVVKSSPEPEEAPTEDVGPGYSAPGPDDVLASPAPEEEAEEVAAEEESKEPEKMSSKARGRGRRRG